MATVTDEKVKIALARMVYYADFIKKDGVVDTRGLLDAMERIGEHDTARAMDAYEEHMLRMGYVRRIGSGKLVVTEEGKRLSGL